MPIRTDRHWHPHCGAIDASDYTLAKVTFTGDSAAGHASLVTIAAEALGVPTPSELGAGGELNVRAERF